MLFVNLADYLAYIFNCKTFETIKSNSVKCEVNTFEHVIGYITPLAWIGKQFSTFSNSAQVRIFTSNYLYQHATNMAINRFVSFILSKILYFKKLLKKSVLHMDPFA